MAIPRVARRELTAHQQNFQESSHKALASFAYPSL
jgi:hypothetical protein